MRMRARPGSPRRLVGLVLVVTLAPSILLIALGWRLFQEDRAGELRALTERRERAADFVVSALERAVQQIEQALDQPDSSEGFRDIGQTKDAALVEILPGTIAVSDDVYGPGEALEHQQQNPVAAGAWFRDLARRADPPVKPGALLRVARTLRKQRSFDEALATYLTMSRLPPSIVENVPSDLLARWLRCELLESLGRGDDLRREASSLLDDLRHRRWIVTRAVYDVHIADAARWSGQPLPETSGYVESFAIALTDLRQDSKTQERGTAVTRGRRVVPTNEGPGVAIWRADSSRLVAFMALPSFVEREWLAPERPRLDRQNVRVALQDPAVRGVAESDTVRLQAAESGLPWTVAVTNMDVAAELARLSGRRNLWLTALAALAVLVVAGTAVAARAVSSELAVARLQTDFVSAVSHEFRTPLTSLRQIGEVLQEARVGTEARRQDYYGALVRQTDRLQRLVEALLDFGRMEAGAAPYRLEPVPIDRLVSTVVAEFTDEAVARGEHVNIHLTSTAIEAPADREAISNVVWNLLDNAIKYSPGAPEAWVDIRSEDGGVAIRVRDRGMGIPQREQRDIFRKFQRGARAKSERIRGTGIGLAIVHHVVTAHGGRVSVQSEPDAGSTFTVWLPASAAQQVRRPDLEVDVARRPDLSASARAELRASYGETRRSLGEGGQVGYDVSPKP